MTPQRPFDPTLLDAIEETVIQWRGVVYNLSVKLVRVADLRNLETLERCEITSEMVMGEDLSKPQLVGGAAAWLQCAGMLIPSARDEGVNLVVFVNNMAPTDGIDLVSQEVYRPTS